MRKTPLHNLKYDPIPSLLNTNDQALRLFISRDLLEEKVLTKKLWQLPEAQKIIKKQRANGSWQYPTKVAKELGKQENYDQYETYNKLSILIEKFGFDKTSPVIQKTAEYFFAHQSPEGDFRGIYDKQYTPNYTAGITELLIKAGYEKDTRIEKVFEWLLSIRQEDGGWALPLRTRKYGIGVTHSHSTTIQPDKTKPFSAMITGVVLRAFAAHPKYKKSKEAYLAGKMFLSSIFKRDYYPDRASAEYWLRFSFPFCYTDLISALDSLSLLGFSAEEPGMQKALQWFVKNQLKNGLWEFKIVRGTNRDVLNLWLGLAVLKVFKRLKNK